ncbi:MAG: caspase family protein [Candidatus Obscuribacterales bacterium]|nr:caspase family protein [Candidatus Obscuribacterales bacterium]
MLLFARFSVLPLLCAVLLTLLCSLNAPVQAESPNDNSSQTPVRDKWALVIGISNFKDPKINLKYPAKDARDFADFLVKQANFAGDHVKVLVDDKATRSNILDMLADKWLPRVAAPDDLVVIYVSSHGSPSHADVGGANFLVAHDTDPERLFSTGISMQELASIVKERVHSDRVVLFLDACHSGAARTGGKGLHRQLNFNADNLMQGTGQLVVCSSRADQISWESQKYENGVFTRQLINALGKEGKKTRLGSAFADLKDSVQEEVLADRGELQTPVMESKWRGSDLLLSCLPTKPRAVPNINASVTRTPTSEPGVTPKPSAKSVPVYLKRLDKMAAEKMSERQYDEALKLYEILRAGLEATVGRDTKHTTECLTQLGWLYTVKGRLADAESLQRESVRINATLYGPDSFFVARETTLLCNTLLAMQDYVEATPVAMRAIELWEGLGGKENPHVLESLVNMAAIDQHFKKYDKADDLLERAQKIASAQNLAKNNPHRLKLQHRIDSLRQARRGR